MSPVVVQDALKLANLGFPIFPVKQNKVPFTANGFKDASTDPDTIKAWWRKHTTANIGIATEKLAVVDVDGEEGAASLAKLEAELGALPATCEQRTPRGGRHLVFSLPAGTTVPLSVSKLGRHIDVRGRGGYIASGKGYTWVRAPEEGLEELPAAWVARMVDRPTRTTERAPSSRLADLLANPPAEGERNNWLAKVAGHLAIREQHQDAYEAQVRALAPGGLDEAEVEKLIRSIWTSERSKALLPPEQADVPALLDRFMRLPPSFMHELREQAKLWKLEAEKDFREKVAQRLESLRVTQEAQAQLNGVSFRPPEIADTLDELLAAADEEQPMCVAGLLGRGHNALLAAQYKAGKTTLLMNLARSLVDGAPFLGLYDTDLQGRVGYLNYELTDADAKRWLREIGLEHPERVLMVGLRGQPNPLASEAGRDWLVDTLAEHGVSFLVIDTFRASFIGFGDSHNDNARLAIYTAMLDSVKLRAGVQEAVLSHHFGRKEHERGEEHGQGAVELDNWADMRWLMTKNPAGQRFLAVSGRGEGLDESQLSYDPLTRRLTVNEPGLGRKDVGAHNAKDAVVLAVTSAPGISTRDLKDRVRRAGGVSTEDYEAARKALIGTGRVLVKDGPKNSKLHFLPRDIPAQAELGEEL